MTLSAPLHMRRNRPSGDLHTIDMRFRVELNSCTPRMDHSKSKLEAPLPGFFSRPPPPTRRTMMWSAFRTRNSKPTSRAALASAPSSGDSACAREQHKYYIYVATRVRSVCYKYRNTSVQCVLYIVK